MINIIPQDIGRVLLNLINNAFYAVSERSKKGEPGYAPTVTVTTRQTVNSQLLVAVKDNGSGIPACETGVVDSELYFLYVLKRIEENSWNVTNGIVAAVNEIVAAGETGGMNFVLSDGFRLWAFRRGQLSSHTLYYLHDAAGGYAATASQYPTTDQGSWVPLNNYELAVLSGTDAPAIYNVTSYATELLVDSDFNGSADSAGPSTSTTGTARLAAAWRIARRVSRATSV